ncbi:hypothetical protein ACJRO7_034203 [Eucalyptus globulus]|uniref:Uncharacterized protein n=1 Tax=Eucalyptus globulus TaxID=34317 RepID=A0ABD3J5V2_EUCGL
MIDVMQLLTGTGRAHSICSLSLFIILSSTAGERKTETPRIPGLKFQMERVSSSLPSSPLSRFARCMSPSCFPLRDETEYHRLSSRDSRGRRSRWKWRHLLKRIVTDGMCIYRSKPVSFHYDAISYSQNFDEGRWRCEYGSASRFERVS